MKTPEHILARNRERQRQREQLRKDAMHEGIRRRIRERDETERQCLQAILKEHQRETPCETALALAWTIHELRDNFEKLSRIIGPAVEGKGQIGLWPYGRHREQHIQRIVTGKKRRPR